MAKSTSQQILPVADFSSIHLGPRRLSKPRTNKSSSNLLAEQPTTPMSPYGSPEQDYFGQDAVVVDSRGQRRSRSKSRGRLKAYLYGSSYDLTQNSSDDEVQTGIVGAARDVRRRLSRTGSSIMPLQSAKASATRLSNSSSSGLLSTRSTESQEIDPEESAIIVDQIKHRAYCDSLAAQNHVSTPVDEGRHVDSIMAPLRRKSLYTPGIATRDVSDILRKPPKPSTDHDYYYDPSRSENSPLSDLAVLNVGDGRSTPSDLHYSQLGGLQLGTLRITNGTCSPVPGGRLADSHRSVTPESKSHDEYYTASEGSVGGDGDHATPLTPRGGSPSRFESGKEANIRSDNGVLSNSDKFPPFERTASNKSLPVPAEIIDQTAGLGKRSTDQSARFQHETVSDVSCLEEKTSTPTRSPMVEDRLHDDIEHVESHPPKMGLGEESGFELGTPIESCSVKREQPQGIVCSAGEALRESFSVETRPSQFGSVERRMPFRCFSSGASGMADEYIAELDDSPFSYLSREAKGHSIPQSQDPAKRMWRSFIDDAEVQHAGSGSNSRDGALRKLTGNGTIPSTRQPERLHVPFSQPLRCSASSETPQADSGYFSQASLTGTPAHKVCDETGVNSTSSSQASTFPQNPAVETVRFSARSPLRIPLRKLQKQRSKSQPPPVNIITGCHEFADANIPRIPSVIAARHAKRLSQFPILECAFPSLQHTAANRTLSPVHAHGAPIRFPSPAYDIEAASTTSKSSPTASSRPQACSIVGIVGDENERDTSDIVRSPSWSEFGGDGRRRKEQKKLAKAEKGNDKKLQKEEREVEKRLERERKEFERQIKKDQDIQRSTRSRSASKARRRSSDGQSRHDTMMMISDFGTVTESLGNSPYDIANLQNVNNSKSTLSDTHHPRNWHPHQISTAMPRPKSVFGSDILSQTMLLDLNTVPALAAVDLKTHNLEWTRARQRSQSLSVVGAESFRHRNSIPGILLRPHSMTEDAPPVPALPSAKEVKQREAEIIRSRPQSMVVEPPVPKTTSRESEGSKAVPYPSELGKCVIPRKTKDRTIVPSLWSNGSLERKAPKTVERSRKAIERLTGDNGETLPAKDSVWGTPSQVWSQRRKSAGEALLKNRAGDVLDSQDAATPAPFSEDGDRPAFLAGAFTSGDCQTLTHTPSHPNPLASHPQSQPSAQQPTNSWKTPVSHHPSTPQQTQRLDITPLDSPPRPSVSYSRHESILPASTPQRAQTQSFQIRRKRVGSGLSVIRAESAIGSSLYQGIPV